MQKYYLRLCLTAPMLEWRSGVRGSIVQDRAVKDMSNNPMLTAYDGAQVLAIINDFGIGNSMEGNDEEASGEMRARELAQLAAMRNCDRITAN